MPLDLNDAFDFVLASFKNPLPAPERWHHADLYPDFNIWGYQVESNLAEPGFIEMNGVTKGGMRISTSKWQPHGWVIPGVQIKVRTPTVYEPNTCYTLLNYNVNRKQELVSQESDAEGRIGFSVNHEPHQIGIYKKKIRQK